MLRAGLHARISTNDQQTLPMQRGERLQLERCLTRREAVTRHFVALSTYLGHTDIAHTYWYVQATPELLTGN